MKSYNVIKINCKKLKSTTIPCVNFAEKKIVKKQIWTRKRILEDMNEPLESQMYFLVKYKTMGDERPTEQNPEFLFPRNCCSLRYNVIFGTLMIRTLKKRADIYIMTSEWPYIYNLKSMVKSSFSLMLHFFFWFIKGFYC